MIEHVREPIGVLGATSPVGRHILQQLHQSDSQALACTRQASLPGAGWLSLADGNRSGLPSAPVRDWICVAPIWVLPAYFDWLRRAGARRIVTISSTSRYTKNASSDPGERDVAQRLAQAEDALQAWALAHDIEWVVLRPTLIYGEGRDRNVADIARVIRRFGFFPVLGDARGLRQPVRASDVAQACLGALRTRSVSGRAYDISGAEVLPYREMITRIARAMGKRPIILSVPLWSFGLALQALRRLPRYRHWTMAMAERMNRDQAFDHQAATRDFNFHPQAFHPTREDVQP